MAQWSGREARGGGGTSVVVKMESPDWAVPQSEAGAAGGKAGRGKNARQITWVLLLKAHRAAGKLTGAASAALSVAAAARRRVAAGRTDADAGAAPPGESPALRTRFYGFLRAFLLLSMLLLAVDVTTHLQGWHIAVGVHLSMLQMHSRIEGMYFYISSLSSEGSLRRVLPVLLESIS